MAAPTIYRSSDASAPVLTGTAGDLINLLDKCLVTGYGAKAAAGWTRSTGFAGNSATRAAFRQGAGNQFYLDINDAGASGILTGATAKEAAVRGYESMTDVSTGTNPFPTTAQIAAATANWRKSNTANATPRGWWVAADDRTFHIGMLTGDQAREYKVYTFGDFYSYKSGDAYRACIYVHSNVNGGYSSLDANLSGGWVASLTAFYVPRVYAGTGTSVSASLVSTGTTGTNALTWPDPNNPSGGTHLTRYYITDSTTLRGYLRGVYRLAESNGLADGDTLVGSGALAGRTYLVCVGSTAGGAAIAIETTDWDTSS